MREQAGHEATTMGGRAASGATERQRNYGCNPREEGEMAEETKRRTRERTDVSEGTLGAQREKAQSSTEQRKCTM